MLDFRQYGPDLTQEEASVISNDNFNRLQIYTDNLVPAATVTMTAATNAPKGWLICDGAAVSRSQYKALFDAIGTTYGVGNGTTTFNLPNLKGRVVAGRDTGQTEFNTMGKTGGANTHTLSWNEMPVHNHGYSVPYKTMDAPYGNNARVAWEGTQELGRGTGNAGAGWAHNNLQPYLTMNYIIKT